MSGPKGEQRRVLCFQGASNVTSEVSQNAFVVCVKHFSLIEMSYQDVCDHAVVCEGFMLPLIKWEVAPPCGQSAVRRANKKCIRLVYNNLY